MPAVQVKTDSGDLTHLKLETDSSEVVLSAEGFAVRLEAAQLDELMSALRDLRRKLRQERKGKNRPKDISASTPE
jgi:hypothetical protein